MEINAYKSLLSGSRNFHKIIMEEENQEEQWMEDKSGMVDCDVALSEKCIEKMQNCEHFLDDIQEAHGDDWPDFSVSFFYFFLNECSSETDDFWQVVNGLLRREQNTIRTVQFGIVGKIFDMLPSKFEYLVKVLSTEIGVDYFLNSNGIYYLYKYACDGYERYFVYIAEILYLISKKSFEYFMMMETPVTVIFDKLFLFNDKNISKLLMKSIKKSLLNSSAEASTFFGNYILNIFDIFDYIKKI